MKHRLVQLLLHILGLGVFAFIGVLLALGM